VVAGEEGYILLARKLASPEGWPLQLRPGHFKFLVLLLLRARWREGEYRAPDGAVLLIKRGQHASSVRRLAREFNLSYKTCRTAIAALEQAGFLAREVAHGVTVLTVRNYERYQDGRQYAGARLGAPAARRGRRSSPLNKEEKAVKEEVYRRVFAAWNEHPRIKPTHRRLTTAMRQAIAARLADFTPEQLVTAVTNYGDSTEEFWVEWREARRGWTLDQFLSRGEGAKVEKFLPGPLCARGGRRAAYTGAVNPARKRFIE